MRVQAEEVHRLSSFNEMAAFSKSTSIPKKNF
jgi:hypothetical protein